MENMNYIELKNEIIYLVSLFDDDEQVKHHAAYLAELTEQLAALVNEG